MQSIVNCFVHIHTICTQYIHSRMIRHELAATPHRTESHRIASYYRIRHLTSKAQAKAQAPYQARLYCGRVSATALSSLAKTLRKSFVLSFPVSQFPSYPIPPHPPDARNTYYVLYRTVPYRAVLYRTVLYDLTYVTMTPGVMS